MTPARDNTATLSLLETPAAAPYTPQTPPAPAPLFAMPEADPRAERRRTRRLWFSFIATVLLPVALAIYYLYAVAGDQFASRVAFSVRASDPAPQVELFGALGQTGSSAASDGEIVFDFIDSQAMVETARALLPLTEIFARPRVDLLYHLPADAPIEDLHDHWRWMTLTAYDAGTGIVTFEARAYRPEDARAITALVLAEATRLVNALSEQARQDAVGFAAAELAEAEDRLRTLRREMRDFRRAELAIDPSENARASLALVAQLEGELAATRVRLNTMRSVLSDSSPRVAFLNEKITQIQAQIRAERQRVGQAAATSDPQRAGADGAPALADLLSRYEALEVEQRFAETAYTSALTVYEQAQAEARRQIRYLATHIPPTRAEASQHPKRALLSAAATGLMLTLWLLGLLLWQNLRDRV